MQIPPSEQPPSGPRFGATVERVRVKPDKIGPGRTVLVVDDNPVIRKAIAKAFLSDGFAICGEADNGRDAVDLTRKFKPNLIVLDIASE
jgi:PleD family two-component response regulator